MTKRVLMSAGVICFMVGCSSSANDLGGKTSPQLSDKDNQFLTTVAEANMAEIKAAQMALADSQSDSVKHFANMMITDHEQATTEESDLANGLGYVPPTMLDTEHQDMVGGLQGKIGSAFDKAYIDGQIKAHQSCIDAAENEANNGSNQQVKNFAQKLLPTLQKHLAAAKDVQAGASGMSQGM